MTRPLPKHWVREALGVPPVPIVIAPEAPLFVATRVDEIEKLAIGHHVSIDFKSGDVR